MAKKNHCGVGLDQRCRDNDGEIRQKRGDTLVRTPEKHVRAGFRVGSARRTRGWTRCVSVRAASRSRKS